MEKSNDSTMAMYPEIRSEGLDGKTKDAIKWIVNKLEKIQFQMLLDSENFLENILEKASLYSSEQKISKLTLVRAYVPKHHQTP